MKKLNNFINGKSAESTSGETTTLVNPATGQPFATAPKSNAADIDAAYKAASDAFVDWRDSTPSQRQRALLKIADAIESRAEEVIAIEVENTGKPVSLTTSEEVPPMVDQIRFFAGAARNLEGKSAGEYMPGMTSMIRREPVGVIGQVTPWNYPMMMAVWKWAPAIAAGNTVVLKPSDTTPASTVWMANLMAEFLPAGVFNVVCGERETGASLVNHKRPDMVSITGSVGAGIQVAESAAKQVKRVHLELGGKAPVVVYQEFVALLTEQAKAIAIGAPHDEDVFLGPVNNSNQLARVSDLLSRVPAHAQVMTGGSALDRPGFFFPATVVAGLAQDDELIQKEIFGPVITVQKFTDEAQAVSMANGVDYGLASSVWTANHGTAMRMAKAFDFGCVWINTHIPLVAEMPHGGFKRSGYGKDLSGYGFEDYTRIKHVMSNLGA